ncbi:SIR2 family protein [Mycolicibacterium goodii]|uniref:SIR2 family protein n=1 Tax=Mycolicibacterium goodii TaxID=134601 RepID=UPI001BDDB4BB|nr:SIR2 family protein [Mycolicibacterium goodii]MBU8831146.1 SIR2 family protein [Mycolicibacterium goodii]
MTASELGNEIADRLKALDTDSYVSVLLGAGASVGAGLPDWTRFLVQCLIESGAIADKALAEAFVRRQDLTLAAEAAKSAAGDRWPAVLRQALYGDDRRIPPAELHAASAAFAAERGPSKIGLFTLNYDLLLEVALHEVLAERQIGEKVSTRSTKRRARTGFEVHHLHGALPPTGNTASSVILTVSDYNRIGSQSRPWQVSALQDALERGPLILAGTSYRDPDIRQWMHELTTEDDDPEFPVLVFLARESLGLSRSQFDSVRQPLIDQWSAIGVTAIPTNDHLDAAQALRELPHVHDPQYVPPAVRAKRLWVSHLDGFGEVQEYYAAELDSDLRAIHGALPETDNMTLWIADDHGNLVRWASNDRIYRRPDQLRAIEPGHDSDWIAGRCLARSDLLAQEVEQSSTARWQSVVAVPLVVAVPGGPDFTYGVLSTGSTGSIDDQALDVIDETYAALSSKWSERLLATHLAAT